MLFWIECQWIHSYLHNTNERFDFFCLDWIWFSFFLFLSIFVCVLFYLMFYSYFFFSSFDLIQRKCNSLSLSLYFYLIQRSKKNKIKFSFHKSKFVLKTMLARIIQYHSISIWNFILAEYTLPLVVVCIEETWSFPVPIHINKCNSCISWKHY